MWVGDGLVSVLCPPVVLDIRMEIEGKISRMVEPGERWMDTTGAS